MVLALVLLAGCGAAEERQEEKAWIFLIGERHGKEKFIQEEFNQWRYYYEKYGFRHMMVEIGYCSAQMLNLWMKAEDDEILETWFANVEGTPSHVPETLEYYRNIKKYCPETVFHGTDVEHQWETTSALYIEYLEESGLTDTEEYALAQEAMEQGRVFYQKAPGYWEYRERCMVDNFIREYERLDGAPVWGVYGSDHVDPGSSWPSEDVPWMAYQLYERYGDLLVCWDILKLTEMDYQAVQTLAIDEWEYQARRISRVKVAKPGLEEQYREYWRLEDGDELAGNWVETEEYLSKVNCAVMRLGDVILCRIGKSSGTEEWQVYRCDGEMVDGQLVARRIEMK